MLVPTWVWLATLAAILAMLAADMLSHRGARGTSVRQAALWSAAWIAMGVAFGLVVWAAWGAQRAGEYFGGYLLEKSLSVDNIAVFALIFTSFAVPRAYQHRVLFLGVVGALAMRAALIAAGAALRPALAVILAFVGLKMLLSGVVHIPVAVSLAVIVACLGGAALASALAGHPPAPVPGDEYTGPDSGARDTRREPAHQP